jgi:hypothetical protein
LPAGAAAAAAAAGAAAAGCCVMLLGRPLFRISAVIGPRGFAFASKPWTSLAGRSGELPRTVTGPYTAALFEPRPASEASLGLFSM